MFLEKYGLREQPFGLTPDPRFLYLSATHREALSSLYYGLVSGRGFMTLIAPVGMGKTTLLYQLLARARRSTRTAFLFQTQCDRRELLQQILHELAEPTAGLDLVTMHDRLNALLVAERRAGRRVLLVIDEAQNLDESVLESARLLSDFETPDAKLLQIILAGQPELARKLARPSLAQLGQRIAIRARLDPFSPLETAGYVEHRLKVAGYVGPPLFDPGALGLLAERAQGIPRNIDNLCFAALSLGCALGRSSIDGRIMEEAIADLGLDAASGPGPARAGGAATLLPVGRDRRAGAGGLRPRSAVEAAILLVLAAAMAAAVGGGWLSIDEVRTVSAAITP